MNIINGTVIYVNNTGTLILNHGNTASIRDNSKLYISGQLITEPGTTINIGDKNKKTGGYLIINSLHEFSPTGLTININNKDSHLEIHSNKINLTKCTINNEHGGTFHIQGERLPNVLFNPLYKSEI